MLVAFLLEIAQIPTITPFSLEDQIANRKAILQQKGYIISATTPFTQTSRKAVEVWLAKARVT